MKKFLILFLLFINPIYAKEYYGEYTDYSNWTFDEVIPSDTIYVEKDKWYKYYYEKIDGKFFIEGDNTLDYPYIDSNNSYYTLFSDYSKNIPSNIKNRIVEIKTMYQYVIPNNVRYIKINNINGGYGSLRIPEISITDMKGNSINYKYSCNGCNENFSTHINNNIIIENMSYIKNGGELIIDLQKEYYYDDIKISISLFDVTNETKTFDITFMNSKGILQKKFNSNFSLVYLDDIKTFSFDYKNMNDIGIWQDTMYESDKILSHTKVISNVNYYRYKDLYYFYYNKKKIYSDYLSEASIEYPIRSDDYKYVYRYKTRDKVYIPDDILITDMNQSIYDYIESEVPINIEGNIDMSLNGVYEVSIEGPFFKTSREVIVDIEENDIKKELESLSSEYEKLLNDYRNIEAENILLTNSLNELNVNYEKLKKDSESDDYEMINKENISLYNKMIEDVNNYKIEINRLNLEIADYQNRIDYLEDSKYKDTKVLENEIINLRNHKEIIETPNYNFYYLGIIGILIIVLIFCIKKSKKN